MSEVALYVYRVNIHRETGKHRSGCTGANQLFAVHKMAVYTLVHLHTHTHTQWHIGVYTQKRMW